MRQTEFDDPAFLARLRQGDQAAYRLLIRRFHVSLTSVAASIIGSRAQAEEVVQDAWLAVFSGIDRFEGRSSLTTWIFSIVLNRARTRIGREKRLVGLPSILDGSAPGERAMPATSFKPDGHWVEAPRLWDEISPERIVGGRQLWDHVQDLIERLPTGQRAVIILRDMEQRDPEEICQLLAISAENQRVLLHRARARLRQAIDELTAGPKAAGSGATAKPTTGRRRGSATGAPRIATMNGALIWAFGPGVAAWHSTLPRFMRELDRIGASLRACSVTTGSAGATDRPIPVMVGEGRPSTTFGAGRKRVVDGGPPPTVTGLDVRAPSGAVISGRILCESIGFKPPSAMAAGQTAAF